MGEEQDKQPGTDQGVRDESPQADGCPTWAVELILKIRLMEIELGNINPAGEKFATKDLDKLIEKLSDDEDLNRASLTETAVEGLFRRLAKELTRSGHSPEIIAKFINSRVAPESRLPYCDASEVRDAMSVR